MDIEALKRHIEWAEGRRKFPYEDSAVPPRTSIGVGRNLDDKGLRDSEIDFLLANDMDEAIAEASKLPYWSRLDDVRQLVICDLVFNLGLPRFLGFIKTNAALERGDYEEAAREMTDSKWYRQTGRRSRKLVEAMRSGEWVPE